MWAIGALVVLFLCYLALPELWVRMRLRRLAPSGDGPGRVALSFDDGPDPRRTPQVLEALQRVGVSGTFFCTGERAAQHPELVRQIAAAGHEVGSHGFRHRHPWGQGPVATWRDIARGKQAVEQVLGERVVLYRPPWGMANLAVLAAMRAVGMELALYHVESRDWEAGISADEVARTVVARVGPGAVVLLHDGARGRADSGVTAEAVGGIVESLRAEGYEFVRMSELQEPRASVAIVDRPVLGRLWLAWEGLFARLAGVLAVSETVHVTMGTHHGRPVTVGGGEVLQPGERYLEMHLVGSAVYRSRVEGDVTRTVARVMEPVRRDMGRLAEALEAEPRFREVRGFLSNTLLTAGLRRLGFREADVTPSAWRRFIGWYQGFVMRAYSGRPARRRELALMWMSREEFVQRFGAGGEAGHTGRDAPSPLRKGSAEMDARIEEREAFVVMGTPARGNPMELDYGDIWGRQFAAVEAQLKELSTDPACYGVYFGTEGEGIVDMIAGMQVRSGQEPLEGLVVREVPASLYAVFEATMETIGETWGRAEGEWLPSSGYVSNAEGACFELFAGSGEGAAPSVLIYLAVRKGG